MQRLWRTLAWFRTIDRRVISTLTLLMLAVPLLVPMKLPMFAMAPVKALKAYIDQLDQDELIVIAVDWDSGTKGECGPQTTAILDYLMRQKRPFAIVGFAAQGPTLAQDIAVSLAAKHGVSYGQAWINWGYKTNLVTTLNAMMNDLTSIVKADIITGRPITEFPMMEGVHSLKDVGLLIEITGATYIDSYLRYTGGVPLAHACTAVIGPEAYPYLQSGQFKGLLVGLGGAAQFEEITGFEDDDPIPGGEARKRMGSQSLGHLLIMLLIVLGNLGAYGARRLGPDAPPSPPFTRRPPDDRGGGGLEVAMDMGVPVGPGSEPAPAGSEHEDPASWLGPAAQGPGSTTREE